VDDPFQESLRLRADRAQIRLNFIRTDLEVCLTLTGLAETKFRMGNRERAERILARAEKRYSDLLRFSSLERGIAAEGQRELQSKFKKVRERLDGLKRLR
jgi:hypothetical protein